MQRSFDSFFRFVLGFSLFIAISFGITYAVTTIEVGQQKEEQTAAAFQVMMGDGGADASWWTAIFK